jgi:tRNA pseudouridine-54 N-methylase
MSGVITILSKLAAKALVVSASKKDAVAVALYITSANNDVAVAVNLCCIHIHSPDKNLRVLNNLASSALSMMEAKGCLWS